MTLQNVSQFQTGSWIWSISGFFKNKTETNGVNPVGCIGFSTYLLSLKTDARLNKNQRPWIKWTFLSFAKAATIAFQTIKLHWRRPTLKNWKHQNKGGLFSTLLGSFWLQPCHLQAILSSFLQKESLLHIIGFALWLDSASEASFGGREIEKRQRFGLNAC